MAGKTSSHTWQRNGAPRRGVPIPLSIVQSDDSGRHGCADPLVERFGTAEGHAEVFRRPAQPHRDGGTHHAADGGVQKRPSTQQVDAEAVARAGDVDDFLIPRAGRHQIEGILQNGGGCKSMPAGTSSMDFPYLNGLVCSGFLSGKMWEICDRNSPLQIQLNMVLLGIAARRKGKPERFGELAADRRAWTRPP